MPSKQRGSVVKRGSRWGARWYDEIGVRRFQGGFATKSEAREWVDNKVDDVEKIVKKLPEDSTEQLTGTLRGLSGSGK